MSNEGQAAGGHSLDAEGEHKRRILCSPTVKVLSPYLQVAGQVKKVTQVQFLVRNSDHRRLGAAGMVYVRLTTHL